MADRKVTVVNPSGYQEQLPDTDNLLLAAAPTANTHAVNKLYVDTGLANIDLSEIEADINQLEADLSALDARVTTIEGSYATKAYVDQQDGNLQDQIDAIIAQGELQTLQDVTDLGSTTTNVITVGGLDANGTIDAQFIKATDAIVASRSQSSYTAFVAQTGTSTEALITAGGDATFNGDLSAATLTGDIDQGEY